jgi:hypothetical protein
MIASWDNEEDGSGALKVITGSVGCNTDCFESVMKFLTMRLLSSEYCRVGACLRLKDEDMVHSIATVSLSRKMLRYSMTKHQAMFNTLHLLTLLKKKFPPKINWLASEIPCLILYPTITDENLLKGGASVMKATGCFETSEITCLATQRHYSRDRNSRLYRWDSLKNYISFLWQGPQMKEATECRSPGNAENVWTAAGITLPSTASLGR